jgi:hypothetical protein
MTIEQLNKEMTNEINRLPEGEISEVIFDEEFFSELPDFEIFLEPPDDVMVNAPKHPDDDWFNDIRNTYPSILGMYIPMRSPGQVILFGRNLHNFYWSLVRTIRHRVPYMTRLDLHAAWTLALMKTHEHELFHYNINVLQEMFGGSYTPKIEEALAVAWARMKIQEKRGVWQSSIGRMNGLLYSLLVQRVFAYRSAGYRDWVQYADEVRFKPALLDYIAPRNYARLQDNGVDMERLLYGMIGQMEKGYVEQVW